MDRGDDTRNQDRDTAVATMATRTEDHGHRNPTPALDTRAALALRMQQVEHHLTTQAGEEATRMAFLLTVAENALNLPPGVERPLDNAHTREAWAAALATLGDDALTEHLRTAKAL